jgi:hypothetical protein
MCERGSIVEGDIGTVTGEWVPVDVPAPVDVLVLRAPDTAPAGCRYQPRSTMEKKKGQSLVTSSFTSVEVDGARVNAGDTIREVGSGNEYQVQYFYVTLVGGRLTIIAMPPFSYAGSVWHPDGNENWEVVRRAEAVVHPAPALEQ